MIINRGRRKSASHRRIDVIAPLIGGLTLLGTLGSGKAPTDLGAHGFGFLAGVLVGLVAGLWLWQTPGQASRIAQRSAAGAAIAILSLCWFLALRG